jgi:hypothetical protein
MAQSRVNTLRIATDYGLDDRGVEFESRWGQEFLFLRIVQPDSGAHPASCPMGSVGGRGKTDGVRS